jgi:hypothetical protein
MYQGEKLPKEQVAIIQAIWAKSVTGTWTHGKTKIWILAIDDKRLDDNFWGGVIAVEVLPGKHKVLVRFKREVEIFFGRINREGCIEFNAEPGHYYWITTSASMWEIGKSLFILDRTTDKIIAHETVE